MSDWSKDINLETIKEYLQECAENDDYHYEQYQIDIVMHEYIRQKQIIEKLNNIINEVIEELESIPVNANGGDILESERKVYHILKGSEK